MRVIYISFYSLASRTRIDAVELIVRGGVEDTRLEAKAKDTKKIRGQGQGQGLSKDRHSRGQGQECSRPRPRTKDTSASALQKKKKKKVFTKIFQAISKKKVFTKIFQAISTKTRFPKNFSSAPKILTIQKLVLSSSRGQANFRGLEASRPRPRTSKCVLEDVLEAKDVLEDSTSADCKEIFIAMVVFLCFESYILQSNLISR